MINLFFKAPFEGAGFAKNEGEEGMKTDPSRTTGEENRADRMLFSPLKINGLNSS
jgi:hypothetical protein